MRIFLLSNRLDINATQEDKYNFVLNIASGKTKLEEIIDWLTKHIEKKTTANTGG